MNDKELLEYAAKAAGYKTIKYIDMKSNGLDVRYGIDEAIWNGDNYWNPLTDDGDALRLAVTLNIHITSSPTDAWASTLLETAIEPYGDDPYAATRRAIVRVAAEIGKHKEQA